MKKIKSFFYLILCMLLALCMPLAACKATPTSVELLDFADQTETVGLGEDYVLPKGVAFDSEGNDYRVSYEVKDSKGEAVQVLNGRFKVKEMGEAKYVVIASAKITEEEYLTRKITLNVIDRTGPNITVAPTAFAFVGEEYTISGVTVSDNTGETIEPSYAVTKKSDGSSVTVTDGKFTPDSKGEYTLEVKAKDSAGNEGATTAPIYVREPMGAYVIENFNDTYGLPVFSVKSAAYTTEDVVYHETFDPTPEITDNGDERVGVAEGNSILAGSNQYGPHFYFKFHNSFKNVDFEYLYLKVYIQSAAAEARPQVALYTQNETLGDDANGGLVNVNEWLEIRLTAEDIASSKSAFGNKNVLNEGETPMDYFKRKVTSDSGTYLFFIPLQEQFGAGVDKATDYKLFVDEIGYKPMFNPTLDIQESYDLGETLTLNPTVETIEKEDAYRIETRVTDPSGNPVTLDNNQFRLIETGNYVIELTYVGTEYKGYTKYTVAAVPTKPIIIGEYTGTPTQGDTVTIPNATLEGDNVPATVSVGGHDYPMASANTFVASVAGEYTVTYAKEIDGLIYKNTLKIPVSRAEIKANEVISFASQAEMEDNIALESVNADWLPVFEGKNGVVKLSSEASWAYFAFNQLQDMAAYNDYDYLVIRMYLPSSANVSPSFFLHGNEGGCLFDSTRDAWVEYVLSGDIFKTVWNTSEFNAWNKQINFRLNGEMYIDDIYMLQDINDTGVSAVVTNKTATGQIVRDGNQFSVALSEGAPKGASLTVKAPDGSVVADPSNITAVFGEYTVEITCEGYFGTITSTISAGSVFDFAFTTEASVDGANVTLKDYSVTLNGADVKNDANVVITVTLDGYNDVVSVNNLTFTAPFTGATYTVKYEATYSGRTYTFTYSVDVPSMYTAAATEVLNFTEPAQIANTETEGSSISWLANFEGATGVAKMTATGTWGHFGFSPLQDMSVYADNYYIVFRMYIKDGFTGKLWLGGANNCLTKIETGMWKEYYFPAEIFKTNWANCVENYYVYKMALVASTACEMYVDKIYTTRAMPTGTQVLTLSEDAQLGFTTTLDSTITWEESFEGATGVAKMTATGTWGHFGFRPLQDMSVYSNNYYIVFRMYIANGFTGKLWFGGANNCLTKIETGVWKDYYFPAEIFKTNWANCTTAYNVYKMALVASTACEMYVDEIYTTRAMPTGTQVLTFSEDAQLGFTTTLDSTITWEESFEGATGVAKMSATGSWGHFGFRPLQDMSVYAESSFVVFRMYIANGFTGKLWFGGANNCQTAIKTGVWKDYYFPAEIFKTNWANCTTAYDVYKMALVASTACTIYIDEIYTTSITPITGDKVLTLSEQAQIDLYTVELDSTIAYQESFEGATGVAKVSASGSWGFFGFKPAQDMSVYQNCNYVVVRMYIENGFTGTLWFGKANNCLTAVQTGKWVDYYFPAEIFKTNWANSATNYYIYDMALSFSQAGTFYIDEIFVTNTMPV